MNEAATPDARASSEAGDSPTAAARGPGAWLHVLLAALVFGCGLISLIHPMLGEDPRRAVLATLPDDHTADLQAGDYPLGELSLADHRFVVWLVARNARALLREPLALYRTEACYPSPSSLATSEPAVSFGLLGTPMALLRDDPVLIFNFALLAMTTIAFASMYLLVYDWTGVPAAALCAALLYAFHALRISDVAHQFIYDTGWTVLALFCAGRLLRGRSWAAAAGLSLCIGLQIPESFYPLLAAVLLALPFSIWALWRFGAGHFHPLQIALVVVATIAFAALFMSPFLELREGGGLVEREQMVFRPLGWIGPGRSGFAGLVMLALVAVALSPLGRRGAERLPADPRFAIAVGGLLIMAVSLHAGGEGGESKTAITRSEGLALHPYLLLARLIPGFELVRGPGSAFAGAHMALALLAGLGAAALLRTLPRRHAPWIAALLVALAYVDTLRPESLGLSPRIRFVPHAIRPPEDALTFFEELAALGDRGPILEAPYHELAFATNTERMLLSAYHHRPTSACYNPPPESQALALTIRELPLPRAVRRAGQLGFRTIVLRVEDDALGALRTRRFDLSVDRRTAPLRKLLEVGGRSAWRIPPAATSDDGGR